MIFWRRWLNILRVYFQPSGDSLISNSLPFKVLSEDQVTTLEFPFEEKEVNMLFGSRGKIELRGWTVILSFSLNSFGIWSNQRY